MGCIHFCNRALSQTATWMAMSVFRTSHPLHSVQLDFVELSRESPYKIGLWHQYWPNHVASLHSSWTFNEHTGWFCLSHCGEWHSCTSHLPLPMLPWPYSNSQAIEWFWLFAQWRRKQNETPLCFEVRAEFNYKGMHLQSNQALRLWGFAFLVFTVMFKSL